MMASLISRSQQSLDKEEEVEEVEVNGGRQRRRAGALDALFGVGKRHVPRKVQNGQHGDRWGVGREDEVEDPPPRPPSGPDRGGGRKGAGGKQPQQQQPQQKKKKTKQQQPQQQLDSIGAIDLVSSDEEEAEALKEGEGGGREGGKEGQGPLRNVCLRSDVVFTGTVASGR